jgi:ribosomal-protein-alanine N-acetyltransferase
MPASIQTQRLILVPLTLSQLQLCLSNLPAIEADLGLSISRDVFTERVKDAISKKIEKMIGMDEAYHLWQTYWLIVVSVDNVGAGLAGFKGVPDADGSTEIGYGIDPAYQNKGYMSEAIKALVEWALGHPYCNTVTATAVENPASRRLLEKLGAQLVEENKESSSWKIDRPSSHV